MRIEPLTGLALAALLLAAPGPALAAPGAAQTAPAQSLAELKKHIEGDNRNNPAASIPWAEEALAQLKRTPDPKAELWFLTALVRDCRVLNALERANAYRDQARALAAKLGDERARLLLEVESANLDSARERPAEAKLLLDHLLPALEAYHQKNSGDGEMGLALVRGFRLLGLVCRDLGRFSDAIAAFQRGQQVSEAIGDRVGHARILGQMGILYQLLGRLDDAVASHQASIALAVALRDPSLEATLRLSFANTLGYRGETDPQLQELSLAAALADRAQDVDNQLTATVNMADVLLRKKDYRAALTQADAALKMAQAVHNPISIAISQVNRGIALNRLGNSAEGLKAVQEGLAHFVASQALNDTPEITGILAEEYAFAGDYRRAYETHVQFKTLDDALKTLQDRKHAAEASAAFESDKKQLQIDALERDRRNQARLRLLWIALGGLGFATAGVLVRSRKHLKSANELLADMSLKDPLTSLANRRYLTTRIAEDLAQVLRMQRNGTTAAGKERTLVNIDVIFLMIDIDHFKHVNDQFGHAAGDQVLKQFAFILAQTMRDSDTVVRWGGEEFFVVAKHTSRQDARLVAERIRSRVEAYAFELGNGQSLHKTCSIGYASYPFLRKDPVKVTWEKVAEVADQCLYAAKTMGRNTWVGVHENEESEQSFQQSAGAYPEVAEMVKQGVLKAESLNDQPIVWMG